jgi:hypothetical protein
MTRQKNKRIEKFLRIDSDCSSNDSDSSSSFVLVKKPKKKNNQKKKSDKCEDKEDKLMEIFRKLNHLEKSIDKNKEKIKECSKKKKKKRDCEKKRKRKRCDDDTTDTETDICDNQNMFPNNCDPCRFDPNRIYIHVLAPNNSATVTLYRVNMTGTPVTIATCSGRSICCFSRNTLPNLLVIQSTTNTTFRVRFARNGNITFNTTVTLMNGMANVQFTDQDIMGVTDIFVEAL